MGNDSSCDHLGHAVAIAEPDSKESKNESNMKLIQVPVHFGSGKQLGLNLFAERGSGTDDRGH